MAASTSTRSKSRRRSGRKSSRKMVIIHPSAKLRARAWGWGFAVGIIITEFLDHGGMRILLHFHGH